MNHISHKKTILDIEKSAAIHLNIQETLHLRKLCIRFRNDFQSPVTFIPGSPFGDGTLITCFIIFNLKRQ